MGIMSNMFGKIGGALKRTNEYPYKGGVLGKLKSGFNKVRKFYNNVNAASGGQLGNMIFKGISNAAEATKYIPGYGSAIHTAATTVGKVMRKTAPKGSTIHSIGRALTGKHATKHLGKDSNNVPKLSTLKQHTTPAPSGAGLSNNNITATSR